MKISYNKKEDNKEITKEDQKLLEEKEQNDKAKTKIAISVSPKKKALMTILKGGKETQHGESNNPIRELATTTIQDIYKEIGDICDIVPHADNEYKDKNYIYDINKKGVARKGGTGQIRISVAENGTFTVRFNPYGDDYESYYYIGQGLSKEELMLEMDAFRSFLADETVPATSKIKKEDPFGGVDIDDFLADYVKGLNNPEINKLDKSK